MCLIIQLQDSLCIAPAILSFERAISVPKRGFGPKKLEKMKELHAESPGEKLLDILSEEFGKLKNIKEFINIDISKQFQSSDFGGELSSAQLKYCANDVIYLHKIHEELVKILEREKRNP